MATLKVNNETIVVDPANLPAATTSAKGAVRKGVSVAKVVDPSCDGKEEINGIIDSLRGAGAISNTKFRLIFDANTPSNASSEVVGMSADYAVYETGDTATIDNWGLSLEGYEFKGWDTDKDAVTPTYSYDDYYYQGITQTVTFTNNDITLYAIWAVETITVDYSAGSYGTGECPQNKVIPKGSYLSVDFSPAPTYSGGGTKYFVGWKMDNDGSTLYNEADFTPQNAGGDFYDNTTLYPVFCEQVTLHYDLGSSGATGTLPSDQTYYAGQTVSLEYSPDISLSGKEFLGWTFTDGQTTPDKVPYDTTYIDSNVTLYPVFGDAVVSADPTVTVDTSVLSGGEYVQLKVYYSMMNTYMPQGTFPETNSPTPNTKTLSTANPYAFDLTNASNVTGATVSGTYKGSTIGTTVSVITGNQFQALESPDGGELWSFDTNDAVTITLLANS